MERETLYWWLPRAGNGGRTLCVWILLTALAAGASDAAADQKRVATGGPVSPRVTSLRAAIEDLIASFGDRYPRGREFLDRLEKLDGDTGEAFTALQAEALIANPLVCGQPILYVSRQQFHFDHHNTETMYQVGEISWNNYRTHGYLKTVDLGGGGTVTVLLDPGPTATPRDPDVSFDGSRIVFALRKDKNDDYSIYEMDAKGGDPRQITSATGVFDIHPFYLADDHIMFTSSREPKYCMCNRHIMGNLFRMEPDGANIHQIGKSTLFEGHGSLMPDGRIMYDRWEYVDRNFGDAQGLWTVNPDGTRHSVYYGNNTPSPGGVLNGRGVPGTGLAVCTFSSCHDLPWGAIALLNVKRGVDNADPVIHIWPSGARALIGKGNWDAFCGVQPKYEDPYPLADTVTGAGAGKYFLVSRSVNRGASELCLLDVFGNELVLHRDELGCFDPMPLAPRARPPVVPVMRDYSDGVGFFYVHDVYEGTHMEGVRRGDIKYLRVVESPPKKNWTRPDWNGQGAQAPGMNWHSFENKRILGAVPVEPDGSAYFECPSDRFVYFQVLDADGMMIQSMRSGTIIQSGERQGCIGCHDDRVAAAPTLKVRPQALTRPASKLTGWYGEPRLFCFQREVQPVFTRKCVSCHDFGKPAGRKLILAPDRDQIFNAAYIELWSKRYVSCVGGGPAQIQQARSWGSHPSKLVKVLREGRKEHADLSLNREEMDRIITWVDINAPYYSTYDSAYPQNRYGRSPIGESGQTALREAEKARKGTLDTRVQVSLERPERSPVLEGLDGESEAYRQALAAIRSGSDLLAGRPRADMEGFVPSPKDLERLSAYERRAQVERANRAAIRTGLKLYDKDFATAVH